MNIGDDYEIVQDPKAPKGRRIIKKSQVIKEEIKPSAQDWGTDSGDQFSAAQLRDAIKTATGKYPAGRTSRETLIAQFNKLNAG